MERTDSGWGRAPDPPPRWRALLDRALLGRSGEHTQVNHAPHEDAPRDGAHYDSGHYDGGRHDGAPQAQQHPPADGYGADPHRPYGSPAHPHHAGQPYPAEPRSPQDYPAQGYPAQPPQPHPSQPRSPQPYSSQTYSSQAYVSRSYAVPPSAPPAPPGPPAVSGPPAPPRRQAAARARPRQPGPIEWREPEPPDDAAQRAISVLRRDLGQPRVLAFANPKGGVHKTTATALAAATIGSVRGRGVLAWDDNELRGTLGLRAGSARHARTIRHLVANLAEVEATSGLELAERVDDYLRHASDGTYDVLAGEENPRFAQKLDRYTVQRVLDLLRRTHDLVCVDTGNNVESPNWRTVLQAADQLVVTSVPREDAAFTADWMLDLLHELGLGELASEAVTLLSCAAPGHPPLLDDLQAHFASRTRAVVVVPYDPALESGSAIEPSMLGPETKQAWLRACGVIMEPLTR